jgi:predicted HTH transcriptional regulator
MTKREFLNAVITANVDKELTEYATAAVEALDISNARKISKPSKKQIENEAIKETIFYALSPDTFATAAAIGAEVEISTSKASALLAQLVKSGVVVREEVKGDKGKCFGYKLAATESGVGINADSASDTVTDMASSEA